MFALEISTHGHCHKSPIQLLFVLLGLLWTSITYIITKEPTNLCAVTRLWIVRWLWLALLKVITSALQRAIGSVARCRCVRTALCTVTLSFKLLMLTLLTGETSFTSSFKEGKEKTRKRYDGTNFIEVLYDIHWLGRNFFSKGGGSEKANNFSLLTTKVSNYIQRVSIFRLILRTSLQNLVHDQSRFSHAWLLAHSV